MLGLCYHVCQIHISSINNCLNFVIKNEIFPSLSLLTLEDLKEVFQYAIKSMFERHDGFTNFPFFYVSLGIVP